MPEGVQPRDLEGAVWQKPYGKYRLTGFFLTVKQDQTLLAWFVKVPYRFWIPTGWGFDYEPAFQKWRTAKLSQVSTLPDQLRAMDVIEKPWDDYKPPTGVPLKPALSDDFVGLKFARQTDNTYRLVPRGTRWPPVNSSYGTSSDAQSTMMYSGVTSGRHATYQPYQASGPYDLSNMTPQSQMRSYGYSGVSLSAWTGFGLPYGSHAHDNFLTAWVGNAWDQNDTVDPYNYGTLADSNYPAQSLNSGWETGGWNRVNEEGAWNGVVKPSSTEGQSVQTGINSFPSVTNRSRTPPIVGTGITYQHGPAKHS